MSSRVVRRSVSQDDSVVYCPQCGHANPETARYCMKCGAHLVVGSKQTMERAYAQITSERPTYEPAVRQTPEPGVVARVMLGTVVLVVAIVAGLFLFTSKTPSRINYNPPAYVKDLSVLAEGTKAFNIYFTLADTNGELTAASGTADITIYDDEINYVTNDTSSVALWERSFPITTAGFQTATLGQGSFAHDAIVFYIGRVPYTAFTAQPSSLTGKAHMVFRASSGATLEGDTTLIFDR